MAGSQIESSLDDWSIAKVASFLGVSKGSLYVWSCHDKWGGRYPPAPKRVGRRLVWNPQEVIDYRDRRCAISRRGAGLRRIRVSRIRNREKRGAGVALSKVHAGTNITNHIERKTSDVKQQD